MQLQTEIHIQNTSVVYNKYLCGETRDKAYYTSWCRQPTVNHTLTLLHWIRYNLSTMRKTCLDCGFSIFCKPALRLRDCQQVQAVLSLRTKAVHLYYPVLFHLRALQAYKGYHHLYTVIMALVSCCLGIRGRLYCADDYGSRPLYHCALVFSGLVTCV